MAPTNEKSILTPHQKEILQAVAGEEYFTKRFYLAGGTALAEFYLKHRISEDLDFFTEKQEVNPIAITRFFENNTKKLGVTKIETKKVLGLYSLFLHFGDGEILKVDFNYYPFPRIEKGKKFENLEIESVYDIGVDKTHTIALKPRARDFIDIFFIIKERGFDLKDLFMQAKAKFDWDISFIELGARFMEATELKDYPRMLKPINHNEWKDFFINGARNLKKDIFEK
ncbi:MAG: hypothetical protein LiPW39_382 [Parcubacteria group bacterium LiPW_39]|nr:MAG: hypothetical protein LiPW39_382 [Parcubacteria group bacterium LiPW_39]